MSSVQIEEVLQTANFPPELKRHEELLKEWMEQEDTADRKSASAALTFLKREQARNRRDDEEIILECMITVLKKAHNYLRLLREWKPETRGEKIALWEQAGMQSDYTYVEAYRNLREIVLKIIREENQLVRRF